jgi:hypothetical protein
MLLGRRRTPAIENRLVSSREAAELSSLTSSLEELVRRITRVADELAGTPNDATAQNLYEVERTLQEAFRRLSRLADSLR